MHPIDAATRLCAVIGHPVAHSLSPAIHNAAFAACDFNYVYLAFDVTDLRGFVLGMRAMPSFRGLSVTIPHKLAIQEYLDEIDPLAVQIGSVNTVVKTDNDSLAGYSTDGPGTLRAFAEAGVDLAGKRVLFIGAGGAVRAVAFAFADAKIAGMTLLGRTPSRIDALAADLSVATDTPIRTIYAGKDLHEAIAQHDVIVQGTPVGMYPESVGESIVPAGALEARHVVFDMVYNPHQTRLLQDAAAAGCTTVHGIEMLIHQAALQFELWTGRPAPIDAMRDAVAHRK
ncbi:MAG: shikimate dehydrogenase [Candidatus Hydrogenedentales bacterium]